MNQLPNVTGSRKAAIAVAESDELSSEMSTNQADSPLCPSNESSLYFNCPQELTDTGGTSMQKPNVQDPSVRIPESDVGHWLNSDSVRPSNPHATAQLLPNINSSETKHPRMPLDNSLISPPFGPEYGIGVIDTPLDPTGEDLRDRHEILASKNYTLCGLGQYRPAILQMFATKEWMLFWLCWFCLVQGMVVNGLVLSILSTIERRFDFAESTLGRIVSFYDVGYVIGCVPVSYFGGRHSKPVFLGVGIFVLGIGSFTFSLPHMTSDSYNYHQGADNVALHSFGEISTCRPELNNYQSNLLQLHQQTQQQLNKINTSQTLSYAPKLPGEGRDPKQSSLPYNTIQRHHRELGTIAVPATVAPNVPGSNHSRGGNGCMDETQRQAVSMLYYYTNFSLSAKRQYEILFCFAHLLHGLGATPLFTLGVSYIDENVSPAMSSLYLGVFYTVAISGPAAGFGLSSFFLRYHTDWFQRAQTAGSGIPLEESDPRWVGAWWPAFIISGLISFLAVLPILSFPKVLPGQFS